MSELLMSELLEPLHLVLGIFIAVMVLIGIVIVDIPRHKYRVPKLEQQVTQLEQLLSSRIEETISNSETIGQEPPE